MYYYAVIDANNVVTGIYETLELVSDPLYISIPARLSTYINAKKYDPSTQVFNDYSPPRRILSKFEFNTRFTFDELKIIATQVKRDPEIEVLQKKFDIADEIDLDDPTVAFGLGLLVDKGILEASRVPEIMASWEV